MRTDIVVENKVTITQLIIDTKYYPKALVSSNWSDLEKIRTNYLYQIYAYLNNSQFLGKKKGMLLYPTVEKELNAKFPICGKSISIQTLNLGADWEDIEDRLLGFLFDLVHSGTVKLLVPVCMILSLLWGARQVLIGLRIFWFF